MPSSTFKNKSYLGEKKFKEMQVTSASGYSMKKPSWNKIHNDIEVFDNGTIIVRNKKGDWWELE